MDSDAGKGDDETVDEILGGRLRMIQKKNGFRFSVDALLLAHFVSLKDGGDLIDLGTGGGIIPLVLASRGKLGRILGIDIQEACTALARRNAALNGFDGRIEIRLGDVRRPEDFCEPLSFDAAVFNPPYRRLRSGRMNADPGKALARHEIAGTAGDFLAAARYALRSGGRVYAIYPAKRMVDLFVRMRASGIEPKRVRMVHSRKGDRAAFALVEGIKEAGEELNVLSPLFIYDQTGGYTGEMTAIFSELSASPTPGGG